MASPSEREPIQLMKEAFMNQLNDLYPALQDYIENCIVIAGAVANQELNFTIKELVKIQMMSVPLRELDLHFTNIIEEQNRNYVMKGASRATDKKAENKDKEKGE